MSWIKGLYDAFIIEQQMQNEEFNRRIDEAWDRYDDARKYPRKKKKKIRKECMIDIRFYTTLINW